VPKKNGIVKDFSAWIDGLAEPSEKGRQARIVERTGLPDQLVSRILASSYDPGLGFLARIAKHRRMQTWELVREVEGDEPAAYVVPVESAADARYFTGLYANRNHPLMRLLRLIAGPHGDDWSGRLPEKLAEIGQLVLAKGPLAAATIVQKLYEWEPAPADLRRRERRSR
jgi:hypothetical protein